MDQPWWQQAVVYQLYPRSFQDSNGDGLGDLPGITARLDYLQWLGVTALWLCPIFPSPGADNGYDVADYCAIHPDCGSLADFDRLVAEAHARGIRIVLDLVINHSSDAHPWFTESRRSRDNPKRDWYIWRDGRNGGPPNNWESIFRGPAWRFDAPSGQYYLHLFTARQPDLNWDNPALRAAVAEIARWWLARGVDGFRIDAITHLKKAPGLPDAPDPEGRGCVPAYGQMMNIPGILDYIDELCAAFRGRELLTVGEANGVAARQAPAWIAPQKQRLAMLLHFEHWQLWSNAPRAPLDVRALKRILGRWQRALDGRGWNALYLENTELPRIVNRWGDPGAGRHASATAFATMIFLQQGTPFIYQGQELGLPDVRFERLEDFHDVYTRNRIAELRAAGWSEAELLDEMQRTARETVRSPMPWDDSANGGFTTGQPWAPIHQDYRQLNVARQQDDPGSVLHYFRRLLALRRQQPALLAGHFTLLLPDNPQLFAYTRQLDDSRIAVLCNLSPHPARYRHRGFALAHEDLLLANQPVATHGPVHGLTLQGFEARVYRVTG